MPVESWVRLLSTLSFPSCELQTVACETDVYQAAVHLNSPTSLVQIHSVDLLETESFLFLRRLEAVILLMPYFLSRLHCSVAHVKFLCERVALVRSFEFGEPKALLCIEVLLSFALLSKFVPLRSPLGASCVHLRRTLTLSGP